MPTTTRTRNERPDSALRGASCANAGRSHFGKSKVNDTVDHTAVTPDHILEIA